MTTPQLPPLPEPDRTMWQHGQQIDHYTADQMRAYALAALSTRPVAESIHEANARTLQAVIDELREMLGLRDGESLKEAVQSLSASAAQAGWQPIGAAKEDRLYVVGWIEAEDGNERHEFDYKEDGCWMGWHDFAEHVYMVGGYGVSEKPPYTHCLELAPMPAPIKKEQEA